MNTAPMLFKPEMIRALLDGTKTETRRIFKDAPVDVGHWWRDPDTGFIRCQDKTGTPYGQHFGTRTRPGDLIWAKETHFAYGYWRTLPDTFTKTGKPKREFVRDRAEPVMFSCIIGDVGDEDERYPRWYKRPSLFMEKADSRLTLRVTGFNIERLHDIDEAGAIAEGVERLHGGYHDDDDIYQNYLGGADFGGSGGAVSSYLSLWDAINGERSWSENPWVSVTKFEVLRQNVGEVAGC